MTDTPTTFTVRVEDPAGYYDPVEKTGTTEAAPKMDILFPDHYYDNRPFPLTVIDLATSNPLSGKKLYLNGTYIADTDTDGRVTVTVGGTG